RRSRNCAPPAPSPSRKFRRCGPPSTRSSPIPTRSFATTPASWWRPRYSRCMAASQPQPRMVGGGGRPNIVRLGLARRRFGDLYHRALNLTWPRLIGVISAAYIGGNMVFALFYWLVPDSLENASGNYLDAFFFSVQTMATIGYGKMVPHTVF